jgi:mono/diheme cytochrome c family protein
LVLSARRRTLTVDLAFGLALLAAAPFAGADEVAPGPLTSVRDGVYTEEQARRGEALYAEPCGRCHGRRLNGAPDDPDMLPAPPLAGRQFLRRWDGLTLAAVFRTTQTTMPAMNPGYLSAQDIADILAYMLSVSGLPSGPRELEPELAGLAQIVIQEGP